MDYSCFILFICLLFLLTKFKFSRGEEQHSFREFGNFVKCEIILKVTDNHLMYGLFLFHIFHISISMLLLLTKFKFSRTGGLKRNNKFFQVSNNFKKYRSIIWCVDYSCYILFLFLSICCPCLGSPSKTMDFSC